MTGGLFQLNRIQSIVYKTAYDTNENLLISAPTGAGKTNVALLTVLRTVKNYMDNGVVQRNKFKVTSHVINYVLSTFYLSDLSYVMFISTTTT